MEVSLVLLRDGAARKFKLTEARTVLGRDHHCHLRVPLRDVSRQHCELSLSAAGVTVRDLGSTNGTYVNGKRVAECSLKAGDQLAIGPITFAVQIDGKPASFAGPAGSSGGSGAAPVQASPRAAATGVPTKSGSPAKSPPTKFGPASKPTPPAKPSVPTASGKPEKPSVDDIDEILDLNLDDLDFALDEDGSDIRKLDDDDRPPKRIGK